MLSKNTKDYLLDKDKFTKLRFREVLILTELILDLFLG